ncbi:trypsin-like peptidase domain-containing protein [Bradyrhizobium sp. GCM10023182]|uniref:Trypsin-like peptidase domain-containing protein n=1 Tax=Bradyrhizobium zhengyangense TaxID=2911009 RepID=A0ABS9M010_9BRAD|nr:trypsin-like peptidase domain-containing protein [Bradyrhizobium zhengyangense]MCG2672591.1 trypsin-like peptidase domain-containing protein [Bradyrhizobium zhengyangense]
MRAVRWLSLAMLVLTLTVSQPAAGQIPDLKTGGSLPTLAPLVRQVTPAVVNISVHGRVREDNPLYRDPLFREFFDVPRQIEKEVSATGSGVIVDAQRGYVLTNNHVVEGTSAVQITTKDGRQFSAKVVGRDPPTDVAVLQVQNPTGLKALAFGDSDALEVGDFVLAIGNPFGLGQTVTSGLVSALGRTGLGKQGYEDFIQTDAAINPGNSGGALVSLRGELVGINSAIISPAGGNVGIGFAIPVNMARKVMEQIIANGRVERGRIGISLNDLHPSANKGVIQGAVIAEVAADSPAERAGLRKGDVVTGADDRPIRTAAQLRNTIGLARVGEDVRLSVLRSGVPLTVSVRIAPASESSSALAGPNRLVR